MANFILPDIGEGVENVLVTDILVKKGQTIKKGDIVIIVESEKASMEIPIEHDSTIEKIFVKSGDKISPGDPIFKLNNNINNDKESTQNTEELKINNLEESNIPQNIIKSNQDSNKEKKAIYASPSVRKLARELDCDLSVIKGTGENGRILVEDINNQLNNSKSPIVQILNKNDNTLFNESSKWGFTEKIKLNRIKEITGKRLHESWNNIPHVTQFDQCDVTELDKIRKELKQKNTDDNIKISFIPFFIKAIVKTLKELPIFNSSLSNDGKYIYRKKYFNIGVAVNTDNGLLVPVIKNADKKSIKRISFELTKIIKKSKNKKLSPNDLSGGCITITSLGGIGGTYFTPIINPPEVAILGISKIQVKPILINNKFKARKVLPLSLSYDHRVVDGAQAAEFVKKFSNFISRPFQLR